MAIEDNTVYGLTGAQVKELPEKIEAVKGLARVLTEADYNYPTDNPTSVALWLLEPGLYRRGSGVNVKITTAINAYSEGVYLVSAPGNRGVPVFYFYYDSHVDGEMAINVYTVTPSTGSGQLRFRLCGPRNNLTSTSSSAPLSAAQGKVLNDKIGGDLSNLTTTDKTSLINAINELAASAGGGMTELTSADYNYPADNPQGVALWLLDPGLYYSKGGVYVYRDSLYGTTNSFVAIIGEFATGRKNILSIEQPWNQAADIRHQTIENSNGNIVSNNMITSLATRAYVNPFTASSAPTTSTAGRLGAIIIDTTDNSAYMCVATSPAYEWKKITA